MSTRNTVKDWQKSAENQQKLFAEYLNAIDVCSYNILLNRVAVSLFGLPKTDATDITGEFSYHYYEKKQQEKTEVLAKCILENQKQPNEMKIYCSMVCIYGRMIGIKIHFEEWVYRIPGKENIIFIDRNCHVYKNWNDYLKNNILPKAIICYPENGEYTNKKEQKVEFMETQFSVKNSLGFDLVTSVTVGGLCAAATLIVPSKTPVVWGVLGISVASGIYAAGKNIKKIVNRAQHQVTSSYLNVQSAWHGTTVPFMGMTADGASEAIAESTSQTAITQTASTAMTVTNDIDCTAKAACVLYDTPSINEIKKNDNSIVEQIFQLITCSLLFANAVVSDYQASLLLQNMATQDYTEDFFTKISNSHTVENGIRIRPTNYLTYENICSMFTIAIPYGCLLLRIPPRICSSLEKITSYIKRNQKNDLTYVIEDINIHLKVLWQQMDIHINKCYYDIQWNQDFYMSSNKKEKIKTPTTHTSKSEWEDIIDKCIDNDITIIDIDWKGQKETVHEVIDHIFYKEEISKFEVIKFYHFFLERIKVEVAEKEKEFQNMLTHIPNIKYEELNKMYNIKGDRIQFFANEVMKTYKDIKLIAMKQNYMKMVEEGLQVPLWCGPSCQFDIFYYTSFQKNGTQREKFLKILEQAKVFVPLNVCTVYLSKDSCFMEIHDPQSKYVMAGAVNFGDINNMKGFIIIENKL